MTMQQIERALGDVEQEMATLMATAPELERRVRAAVVDVKKTWTTTTACSTYSAMVVAVGALHARETTLVYAWRLAHLDETHEHIEFALRCIIEKPGTPVGYCRHHARTAESERTERDAANEEALLRRLVQCIEEKSALTQIDLPVGVEAPDLDEHKKKKRLKSKIKQLAKRAGRARKNR